MSAALSPAEERISETIAQIIRDYPGALVTVFGEGVVQAVHVRQVDNAECWPRCDHPQMVKLTTLGPAQGAGATAYLSAQETYWLVRQLLDLLETIESE